MTDEFRFNPETTTFMAPYEGSTATTKLQSIYKSIMMTQLVNKMDHITCCSIQISFVLHATIIWNTELSPKGNVNGTAKEDYHQIH